MTRLNKWDLRQVLNVVREGKFLTVWEIIPGFW